MNTKFNEPFDVAIVEYYGSRPNWGLYRALIEQGAIAGDALALYAMATWFLNGEKNLGIRVNYREGVRLLTKAAKLLNRAMLDLAISYELGRGIRRNKKKAFELYARAARRGCIAAIEEQGRCLYYGIGVTRDRKKAQKCFTRFDRLKASLNETLKSHKTRSK